MLPTRTSQPYRLTLGRPMSETLQAMLAGRPLGVPHPLDAQRDLARRARLAEIVRARFAPR